MTSIEPFVRSAYDAQGFHFQSDWQSTFRITQAPAQPWSSLQVWTEVATNGIFVDDHFQVESLLIDPPGAREKLVRIPGYTNLWIRVDAFGMQPRPAAGVLLAGFFIATTVPSLGNGGPSTSSDAPLASPYRRRAPYFRAPRNGEPSTPPSPSLPSPSPPSSTYIRKAPNLRALHHTASSSSTHQQPLTSGQPSHASGAHSGTAGANTHKKASTLGRSDTKLSANNSPEQQDGNAPAGKGKRVGKKGRLSEDSGGREVGSSSRFASSTKKRSVKPGQEEGEADGHKAEGGPATRDDTGKACGTSLGKRKVKSEGDEEEEEGKDKKQSKASSSSGRKRISTRSFSRRTTPSS